MKTQFMLCATVVALVGCSKPQDLPDPSTAQAQTAEMAYQQLSQRNFEQFMQYLDPKLQAHFEQNPKILKKFATAIPKDVIKSKTLMTKRMENPQEYTVSYEISYPKNLVQYDVSFNQPNGSTKINNINIQVFGE